MKLRLGSDWPREVSSGEAHASFPPAKEALRYRLPKAKGRAINGPAFLILKPNVI
jgi:hypothetical protein